MRRAPAILSLLLVVLSIAACDTDNPNNPGDKLSISVEITKPTDRICVSPGTQVQFEAAASGGGGSLVLHWSFGDATIADPGNTDKPSVTFNNKGVWTVEVTASTATESKSSQITVLVKDDCTPLEAAIAKPFATNSIYEGQSLIFEGYVAGGEAPLTYRWEFGGAGIANANVKDPGEKTFNLAGKYNVRFTVIDAVGDSTAAVVEVNVLPALSEPPVGTIPVAVDAPDGLHLIRNMYNYANLTPSLVLLVAGGDGVSVLDPVAGSTLSTHFVAMGEIRLGVLGLSHALTNRVAAAARHDGDTRAPQADRYDVLVQYGSTSALTPYDFASGDWAGFSLSIEPSTTVYDVSPYGGAFDAEGMITVAGFRIGFIDWDAALDSYQPSVVDYLSSAFPGAGTLVSAFGRGPTGRFVAIASGNPGTLYAHDRTSADAIVVGSVGDDPRKIRGADSLLVVTNFGSDSLTVAKWGGNDNVSIVGNVAVGDGPVGVDLLRLGTGDIAAVTTGFNGNTFTVTVLDAGGGVVSNTTTALPAGCTNPGHAVWVGGTSTRIIVSCFGSNNLVVVDSGL